MQLVHYIQGKTRGQHISESTFFPYVQNLPPCCIRQTVKKGPAAGMPGCTATAGLPRLDFSKSTIQDGARTLMLLSSLKKSTACATATATATFCSAACVANEYALPGLATGACKPCPATTEPTPDKSACRCLAGRSPQLDTSWEQGTLSCEGCPAGEQQATASSC